MTCEFKFRFNGTKWECHTMVTGTDKYAYGPIGFAFGSPLAALSITIQMLTGKTLTRIGSEALRISLQPVKK